MEAIARLEAIATRFEAITTIHKKLLVARCLTSNNLLVGLGPRRKQNRPRQAKCLAGFYGERGTEHLCITIHGCSIHFGSILATVDDDG